MNGWLPRSNLSVTVFYLPRTELTVPSQYTGNSGCVGLVTSGPTCKTEGGSKSLHLEIIIQNYYHVVKVSHSICRPITKHFVADSVGFGLGHFVRYISRALRTFLFITCALFNVCMLGVTGKFRRS